MPISYQLTDNQVSGCFQVLHFFILASSRQGIGVISNREDSERCELIDLPFKFNGQSIVPSIPIPLIEKESLP